MTPLTRFAQAGAAVVVAALALCAAGTGPAISEGAGCSISCIETALVTPTAETDVGLRAAFVSGEALPAGYGGDLPAGHDTYAVFSTDGGELRFHAYATVDVRVA